jgi:hypothetical protein
MALLCSATLSRADLTHRYSFTDDATDSVAAANGTPNGGVTIGGGSAFFDGINGSFIELPPGLISNYTSVTFDFWIDVAGNGNWPELYAFGDRNAAGQGAKMLMFTPHSGNNDYRMSFADTDPGFSHESVVTQPGVLDFQGPIHITCVYDIPNHFMGLYTNGVLAASRNDLGDFFNLTNIANVHSWLGQSLYEPDAWYSGTIDEFRIFNHPLSAIEVAGSQVGGPDTVSLDPGAISTINIAVKNPLPRGGTATAVATADFANIQGVKLAGVSGVTYTSGNTNVFTVDTNGNVVAIAPGSTALTVSFNGKTATQTINVSSDKPTELEHRYSFTDDATDLVGDADGILLGAASLSDGQVVLDGIDSYVEFPPDMLTNYDSVTFEAWVTDNGSARWARIWDFGNSVNGPGQQGGGTTFFFLSLPDGDGVLRGTYAATGLGENVLRWPGGRPAVGEKAHIVWTSDITYHIGKLYVNGALVGVNTNMTITPRDIGTTFNNWLGRSQFNDPYFNGAIDEFRIYNGAITPLQVALNAASGPDNVVTNAGTLNSVALTIGTNEVLFGGMPVRSVLSATFENLTNVNVTTLEGAQFSSANPNIATISSNGIVTATGVGTTTLTASFNGKTNTLSVTVQAVPGSPATLVHRYSFSDAPDSTTVKDSVGSADGQILGQGATLDGTQLTLPGGTGSDADPSVIAGYVDLPNGIISVMSNITVEAWVTYNGSGSWQRIFDFGTSAGGEDISNGNGNYLFMTPAGPNNLEFSVRDPLTGSEPAPIFGPTPLGTGSQVYLAVVYNHSANVATMYSNGVQVAIGPAPIDITTIEDVNNWLGRSQWPDQIFNGKYNEFRIWDGALLPSEIQAHLAAGPDALEPTQEPSITATKNGNNIEISWSASATGFVLQSSPAIAGPGVNWTTVSTAPVINNGVSTVTIPIDSGTKAQFYRLIKTP